MTCDFNVNLPRSSYPKDTSGNQNHSAFYPNHCLHQRYLLAQSQQCKHQSNKWNQAKVNSKDNNQRCRSGSATFYNNDLLTSSKNSQESDEKQFQALR